LAVNPYSSASILGYNSSPPPDDGSQTSANKVEWAKHKTKLTDPIKTLVETVNTNMVGAGDALALEDAFVSTTSATIAESDWHGVYLQLATGSIYYPDPADLENGWHHTVYNGSTGIVSLQATATSYWLVDGALASEALLLPGRSAKPMNTATVWLPVFLDGVRSGEVVSTSYVFTSTLVSATNTIPIDNTIPVATEGNLILTATHAAAKIGNLQEVSGQIWCAPNSNTGISVALFAGTASAAVAVGVRTFSGTDHLEAISFRYWATATTATGVNYKAHVGALTGAHTVNGTSAGTGNFGGVLRSFISVTEYNV
jgi:hypothetical protein